jgi:hypothetical protein
MGSLHTDDIVAGALRTNGLMTAPSSTSTRPAHRPAPDMEPNILDDEGTVIIVTKGSAAGRCGPSRQRN